MRIVMRKLLCGIITRGRSKMVTSLRAKRPCERERGGLLMEQKALLFPARHLQDRFFYSLGSSKMRATSASISCTSNSSWLSTTAGVEDMVVWDNVSMLPNQQQTLVHRLPGHLVLRDYHRQCGVSDYDTWQ